MGKKTKVVIDTNVIVSAFGWHGKPEIILELVSEGAIVNFISNEMFKELRRVVAYPKIGFTEREQAEIIETMFYMSSVISVEKYLKIIKADDADNRVIECALEARANFIITGDKHLLDLKSFREIEILSPEEFLKRRSSDE